MEYHLRELKIALDPTHPQHILPPLLPISARVLDVGCGAGQTLLAAYPDQVTFGLDVDFEALRFGTTITRNVRFVCGRAEALPYRSEEFDFVVARVSLAYTDITASVTEIRRVLKPGGRVWMTLHTFSIARQGRRINWKSRVFLAYILLNSALFHWVQRQFSVRGRCESFQTERGITRALRRAGFEDIAVTRGDHFLVTAQAKILVGEMAAAPTTVPPST
jgi:SAM-dependent methyltransferase